MKNEQQRKQEIAEKVYNIMSHTNQYKWNIIFGYDCIQIELDKDNEVPLYTDTTKELENTLENEFTVIELNNKGNIQLIYDVRVIDENIQSNERWEYCSRELIKKEIME